LGRGGEIFHRLFFLDGGLLPPFLEGFFLATFTLKSPFSAPSQACGPEARALHGKSIGGQRILTGDPAWLPQNGAGRSGARPGAPTSENPGSRRKNGLPAHSKKRSAPHGFYAQRPCFRAGHGLKFNHLYNYLGKSEGGKEAFSLDSNPGKS
jgi:hypothetical protein